MNETRTTRIIALLAGNGFFLTKLGEHWLEVGHRFLVTTIISILVALVGVSSAYISLFWQPEKRWPMTLEAVSALCFIVNVLWWIWLSRTPS